MDCVLAISGDIDDEVLRPQAGCNLVGEIGIILDKKYAHKHPKVCVNSL
jgi:hypothetical protein